MAGIEELIGHLTDYEQADEDGVIVLASRQAIDESAKALREQQAEIERLRGLLISCVSSVEFDDERIGYVTVQIDREVYNEALNEQA